MSTVTRYEVRGNVALITMDSPPVNGLSHVMRQGILNGYRKACVDDNVKAIVIASAHRIFCAGADINEFGSNKVLEEPMLPQVLNAMEVSNKPIVAAVNGAALGGGLELALACDYIYALPQATFGFPEVLIGLIPGSGGTQRLPRIVGVPFALEMIVSGKPVGSIKAAQARLVDQVHEQETDFIDGAITYARSIIETGAALRDCAEKSVATEVLPDNFFAKFRADIARRTRGLFAPECCIQAVEAACDLPLSDGLKKEAELFMACMQTPQARAQQHLFFAERAATRVPGVDPKTSPRTIQRVAIIGFGTMGSGIAMSFLNAGIDTTILDIDIETLERGVSMIRKNYEIAAKKGRLTTEQMKVRINSLKTTLSYNDIRDADLVVEAVFENMEIKKNIFQELGRICKSGAILATNTSSLNINEIAQTTGRPQDVIGLHFFSPANVMRLVEIVRGKDTADDVIVTSIKLAKTLGKQPVVVGVCFGLVGNRMLAPYFRETCRLILEGASPAQIDRVLYEFGMAMGPCSMADLVGIDVGYLVREKVREQLSQDAGYEKIADKLYELERYGQKTGRGFYIYEGRDKKEDPEVVGIAKELAAELCIEQRVISDQEILERTIYMLINEGAQILDEGIASRSSDCDLIYCNGYGFPVGRGGPMQYADEIGLNKVLSTINNYHDRLGEYGEMWFKPAPILEKLVAEERSFKSL